MRFLLLSILCVTMTLGGHPSGEAASPRDTACELEVAELNSSAYPFGDIYVSWLTGCARTVDGRWIWPDAADDPRLVSPWPLNESQSLIANAIDDQVTSLWRVLETTPYWGEEFDTWADYFTWLDEEKSSAFGLGVGDGRDGPGTKTFAMNDYRDLLWGWLQQANALDLAYMVQWWEDWKLQVVPPEIASVLSGTQAGNRPVALGYFDHVGFWRTPWPWELASPYMIAWFTTTLVH